MSLREEAAAHRAATAAPALALRPMVAPADAAPHSGRRSAAPAAPPMPQPAAKAAPASESSTGQRTEDARQGDDGPSAATRVFRQRRKPALDAGRAPARKRGPPAGMAPAEGVHCFGGSILLLQSLSGLRGDAKCAQTLCSDGVHVSQNC